MKSDVANSRRNYYSSYNFISLLMLTALYAINELFLKSNVLFFKNHFNDLLAMPLLLNYSEILIKKQLSKKFILLLTLSSGIVWEWLVLLWKPNTTPDIIDVIMYFVGSFLWIIISYKWREKWKI